MYYTSEMYRLHSLLVFLSYSNQEYHKSLSLYEIANKMQVPTSILKDDLQQIKKHPLLKNFIIEDSNHLYYLDDSLFSKGNKLVLPFHPLEKSEYHDFLQGTHFPDQDFLYKKLTVLDLNTQMEQRRNLIQDCIDSNHRVHFLYHDKLDKIYPVKISPYYLFHNTTDNLIYMISYDFEKEQVLSYRLDRMVFCEKSDYFLPNPEPKELQLLEHSWGMEIHNLKSTHVKLEIKNTTSNIIHKIKYETASHNGKLYPGDSNNIWFYEEDVIGLNSFASWVLKYGSSIRVIEPQTLIDRIVNSAKRQLKNYEIDF